MYKKRESAIAAFFILAAIALRFFSFFPSVIDHDESTYLLIGRGLTEGKTLYTDLIDTKPAGIFLVYAGLETLWPGSVFLKRFFAALIVGLTAFLVFKLSKKITGENRPAFAAGIIYLFYTSTWSYHGLSPNTELYFNLFSAGGILLLLKRNRLETIFAGLLFGIGFMFKYVVLFDYTVLLLFFFVTDLMNRKGAFKLSLLIPYFLSGLAFLLPFGLANLYFLLSGDFESFSLVTYEIPFKYGGNPSLLRYLKMIFDLIGRFLPISFFLFWVVISKHGILQKSIKYFFTVWVAAVCMAMFVQGQEFSHYTIHLMLPLSILAGLFFHPGFFPEKWVGAITSGKTGRVVLGILILVTQAASFRSNIYEPDYPRDVAEFMGGQLNEGDFVFVTNYEHVVYYLLGQDSPTKYVHSTMLFTDLHKVFGIDNQKTIDEIMGRKPKFVVVQYKLKIVEEKLGSEYELVKSFRDNEIRIYKRAGC